VRELVKNYRAKKLVSLARSSQVSHGRHLKRVEKMIYDRHTYYEERREALGRWAEVLASLQPTRSEESRTEAPAMGSST
jgi:hypothetical protein